jgi:seryl-tRNA synthetase
MLKINYIRDNKDLVIQKLNERQFVDAEKAISELLLLDDVRKNLIVEKEDISKKVNDMSKQIGEYKKNNITDGLNVLMNAVKELKDKKETITKNLTSKEFWLKEALYLIPNIHQNDVPVGNDSDDNLEIFISGDLTDDDTLIPHWELFDKVGIDFESGNKITGRGFPVYKGKAARLQRALINYFLDTAVDSGYLEVESPILVNKNSAYGTGQLPDKDGQIYNITNDELYVIPTGEVPITNIYRDCIIKEEDLPIKNVGYTPCFRREAGTWGADVKGLNRLHQFDKVEIVHITKEEDSNDELEKMRAYVSTLLENLGLPYRILNLCSGDLAFTSSKTYDFEVYSKAQKRWLEVSSVSNFLDFQSNRLKLRYKNKEIKKNVLLHTLNGSALALPRILAALLENNQVDGKIIIPDVLVKYTGFKKIEI